MKKVIKKKILPKYFVDIQSGIKNFEIRTDEDNAQPGDAIVLLEWDGFYTGGRLRRTIKYVLRDVPALGLMDGYCILGW